MKDDGSIIWKSRSGFVDPLYMIFFAVVALGLALVAAIVDPLLDNRPILLWHWISLCAGIAVLAGCVMFIVREHRD